MKKLSDELKKAEALKEQREVLYENEGWLKTNVYNRDLLAAGEKISGPAIIEERSASTLIYEDQHAEIDEYGNIIIYLEG